MSSLLMNVSKAFFISVTVFLISGIYFGFFIRVSTSLLILHARSIASVVSDSVTP